MKWFLALLFVATVFGDHFDDPYYDPLEDCTVTTNKQLCEDFLRRRYGNSGAPNSATTRSYRDNSNPTTTRSPGFSLEWIAAKINKESTESCAFLPFTKVDELKCPEGWALFPETNYCYKAVARTPYDKAEEACRKHSSLLVLPHSDVENYFVSHLAEEDSWLGFQFGGDFFNIKTSDGCPFDYNNMNQPHIQMQCFQPFMGTDGTWNHTTCQTFNHFEKMAVCKRVPFSTAQKPPCMQAPSSREGTCQLKCKKNWRRFRNHCFLALGEPYKRSGPHQRYDPEKECQRAGGRLASVLSKDENEFIVKLAAEIDVTKRVFLGAEYRDNQFRWKDGCPFSYTNWLPNEPNKYTGQDEHCVEIPHLDKGQWNDNLCNDDASQYSIPVCKALPHVVF
ncbi:hypothetical protein QR680_008178 [Steinernema hermaphroditum]|uniref:C-type lectin domain-containing protein n=1 Tax=Steinernema hermaphroditum TaxID=289476 RepID=A0AA39IFP1_9BILA|nr:hypothetical protein QR680_008178 [Steinernema hermaphroditum]